MLRPDIQSLPVAPSGRHDGAGYQSQVLQRARNAHGGPGNLAGKIGDWSLSYVYTKEISVLLGVESIQIDC